MMSRSMNWTIPKKQKALMKMSALKTAGGERWNLKLTNPKTKTHPHRTNKTPVTQSTKGLDAVHERRYQPCAPLPAEGLLGLFKRTIFLGKVFGKAWIRDELLERYRIEDTVLLEDV